MEAYCISGVKLLKAGCQKFRQQFKQKAGFDPMEKCYTVASLCNWFWCKKLLTPNTIVSKLPCGWQGARSNQSAKAFKWLAWEEHLLRRDIMSLVQTTFVMPAMVASNKWQTSWWAVTILPAKPCTSSTAVCGMDALVIPVIGTDTAISIPIARFKKCTSTRSRNMPFSSTTATISRSCGSAIGIGRSRQTRPSNDSWPPTRKWTP